MLHFAAHCAVQRKGQIVGQANTVPQSWVKRRKRHQRQNNICRPYPQLTVSCVMSAPSAVSRAATEVWPRSIR
jgi:phosphoribosyl-dephospho-CoA transferase